MNGNPVWRSIGRGALLLSAIGLGGGGTAAAQGPDHPVITEVYQEPPATGGPVGRDPSDPHQEYIEIYLPPLADLALSLNKDALNLAFYEVEGDSSSFNLALVNYRIDLPTFDLDPSNGLTGLPRPSSGVVVLGWVDYIGNPPTDLAGTPGSRMALINGGVTSTADFTFIAINGAQFTGTTNFPVPVAISHLDLFSDPLTGKIEQGSAAYLLVDRDSPGYAEVCGTSDPAPCNDFPDLAGGMILGTSSLLDGFAGNDDNDFDVLEQPTDPAADPIIDLEFVLPIGGVFSLLIAQIEEEFDGYRRLLVDIVKTTEDGIGGNENPSVDAGTVYRTVSNLGPFGPTPGRAPATTDPAALELALPALQVFEVLTNTQALPGIVAANSGGDFGMDIVATPGASSDPSSMVLSAHASSFAAIGQVAIAPTVAVQTFAGTLAGHTEIVSVALAATEGTLMDPPLVNPNDSVVATYLAIDPTEGLDALGVPFQATAFVAVQGIPDQVGVANEFLLTSLGQTMAANLGTIVFDTRGNGAALINPTTDLADTLVVEPMIATISQDPLFFINPSSTVSDLASTVLGSAEVVSGKTTYDDSFNLGMTLVQAREFLITETPTAEGGFVPTERIHYADSTGNPGVTTSGLTDVVTGRGFQLALIDTNVGPTSFESGNTDDFGLVVEVGQTNPGASVVTGEFVFLSLTGGLEGADLDTLDVPPHLNQTVVIYVDLQPLDSVIGVKTITRLFVVDGSGGGEVNILDVISLPEPHALLTLLSGAALLALMARHRSTTRPLGGNRAGRVA